MDERVRAEVALLLYCCMVSLVTVGSSPANSKYKNTREKRTEVGESRGCTTVVLLYGVLGYRWFIAFFVCQLLSAYCSQPATAVTSLYDM